MGTGLILLVIIDNYTGTNGATISDRVDRLWKSHVSLQDPVALPLKQQFLALFRLPPLDALLVPRSDMVWGGVLFSEAR